MPPRKFGPEPDSDAARDGVFHGERVVALENDARLEPDAFAVLVADAAQLLASVKPDEVRLLQFLETDGVALFVQRRVGHGEVDVLAADEVLLVVFVFRYGGRLRVGAHADVVQGGLLVLHQVESQVGVVFLVEDHRVGHERRRGEHVQVHCGGLFAFHGAQLCG